MDKGFKYLLINAKYKPPDFIVISIPSPLTILFSIYQTKSFCSQAKTINFKLIVGLK